MLWKLIGRDDTITVCFMASQQPSSSNFARLIANQNKRFGYFMGRVQWSNISQHYRMGNISYICKPGYQ